MPNRTGKAIARCHRCGTVYSLEIGGAEYRAFAELPYTCTACIAKEPGHAPPPPEPPAPTDEPIAVEPPPQEMTAEAAVGVLIPSYDRILERVKADDEAAPPLPPEAA